MDYKEAYYILNKALHCCKDDKNHSYNVDIYEALFVIFIALSRLEIIEKGVKLNVY